MTIGTYAQNFEDVLLWRALGHVPEGTYIDVGAQHPVVDSVSKAFYERGWRGIHVEPTQSYAELLREDRPDEQVIQAAVGENAGLLSFHEVPDTGLSTAAMAVSEHHRSNGYAVRESTVTCITLDDLLELMGARDVHWLKIDVEGFEREVLAGWRRSTCRPWVVLVESTYPTTQQTTHTQWEQILVDKGYRFALFDGLNRYYVALEHLELMEAFRSGPNVFDCFQMTETCWAVRSIRASYDANLVQLHEVTEQLRGQLAQAVQSRQQLEAESAVREQQVLARMQQAIQELEQDRTSWAKESLKRERLLADQLITWQHEARRDSAELARAHVQQRAALEARLVDLENRLASSQAREAQSQAELERSLREAAWLASELQAIRSNRWIRALAALGQSARRAEPSVGGANGRATGSSAVPPGAAAPADGCPPITDLGETSFQDKNRHLEVQLHSLDDLISLHDADFVMAAYQLLLKRRPDAEGASYYLRRLRRGTPKVQILGQIRFSAEGRACGVTLPGLDRAFRRHKLLTTPIVGALLRTFMDGEGASMVEHRLRAIENGVFALRSEHEKATAQMASILEQLRSDMDRMGAQPPGPANVAPAPQAPQPQHQHPAGGKSESSYPLPVSKLSSAGREIFFALKAGIAAEA